MSWETKIPARFIDFGNKVLQSNNYIFGIKLISSAGGSGTWMYIDENENIVDLPDRYFEHHPTYKNIAEQSTEGETVNLVKIPMFFIRTDSTKTKFWIAPDPREGIVSETEKERAVEELKQRGFRVHPAFLTGNIGETSKKEYDYILIGAYPLSKNDNNMALSSGETFALINEQASNYEKYCLNRNVSGSEGYHMWNIYEVSAIQMLMMLQCKSTNFQKYYGSGRVNSSTIGQNGDATTDGPATAKWKGIYCLWGNAWQIVDGIKTNANNMLCLYGGDGTKEYGTTDIQVPCRMNENDTFAEGVNSGFYSKKLLDVGARYDTSDLFLPDFSSLTGRIELGTYSDYVYCPTGTTEKLCAVGGDFNSKDEAGLFAYNFDIDPSKTYNNVTSRLAKY